MDLRFNDISWDNKNINVIFLHEYRFFIKLCDTSKRFKNLFK